MNSQETEFCIVIKEGPVYYYLLKVIIRGFDVYCIPPGLGIHFSLHESGSSHFRSENKPSKTEDQAPLALIMGEAGIVNRNGIIRSSLRNLGRASSICSTLFSIVSLKPDFRRFNKSLKNCFIIDKGLFPQGTKIIEVGVWAVPKKNGSSFAFNNPGISEEFLFKVTDLEPEIWSFARSY